MEKCKNIDIWYTPSETLEVQGSYEKVQKICSRDGYTVKESRNGYWVLIKKSKVFIATNKNSNPKNIKGEVLEYYKRSRISKSLVEKFAQDIKKEKVGIYIDEKSDYYIKKL